MLRQWLHNILVGLDQFVNTLAGGSPDETLSSRVQRYRDRNRAAAIVADTLDAISPGHCADALEPDDHHNADVIK